MAVTVRLFADCARWAGLRELSISLPEPATAGGLLEAVPELAPLRRLRDAVRVAVNLEHAAWDARVQDGDEVAFFPPVSGG